MNVNIRAESITPRTRDQLLPIKGINLNTEFKTPALRATHKILGAFFISGTRSDIKSTYSPIPRLSPNASGIIVPKRKPATVPLPQEL